MLAAADALLIPLQCEYYALEGLSQLLNTVTRVQQGVNPSLGIDGVVLTMYDARLNLSRQVAADAREYFGAKVFRKVVPRNVRLAEAPVLESRSSFTTSLQLARRRIWAWQGS